MNTTNVFVELLVIGLGPVTALVLVLLIALGPGTPDFDAVLATGSSIAFIVPMLAFTYILGIIVDRAADAVFGIGATRLRRREFASDDAYHHARRTIIYHCEAIYRLRQYGRSRMRICRGWAVNAVLLVLPANIFVFQLDAAGAGGLWLVNGVLAVLLAGTLLSWRALAKSEYRKIRGGAEFIRAELSAGTGSGSVSQPNAGTAVPGSRGEERSD